MVAAGLGQMGYSPAVLFNMDYGTYLLAYRGYVEQEERRERQQWERIRWQTAALLSVHAKKGKQVRPMDLITFPWETATTKNDKKALELLKAGAQSIDYGTG